MTHITIGGETFNVRIEGDPALPVVMLSHALGANLHLWDGQMSSLLEHFRVVRYDARGHGGSVVGAGATSIARLGQDALAILDALDIDKTHWIGLSMGGLVGQWLLVNAPDRIDRAVLANTAAHFGPAHVWNERIATARHGGMAKLVDTTLDRWFSPDLARTQNERVEAVETAFLATPPAGYADACAALRDADLREDLRRIDHSVLVIAGLDDASITPARTSFLAETIQNATLVTLPARHLSNIEAEDAFNKAMLSFLTGKLTRRAKARPMTPPLPAPRRPAGRRSSATRGALVDARTKHASAPASKGEKPKTARAQVTPPTAAKVTARKVKAGRLIAKASVKAAPARKAKAPAPTVAVKTKATARAVAKTPAKTVAKATRAVTSKARSSAKAAAKKSIKAIAPLPIRAKTKKILVNTSAKPAPTQKKAAAKIRAALTAKPAIKKATPAKAMVAPARKAASKTVAARKPKALPATTKSKTPAKIAAKTTTKVKSVARRQPVKKPVLKPSASRRT